MKKFLRIPISLLLLGAVWLMVSCSASSVGVAQPYQESSIVRLAFAVTDATSGAGIDGATVTINVDNKTYTVVTDNGQVEFEQVVDSYVDANMTSLSYTFQVTHNNYITGYHSATHQLLNADLGNVSIYNIPVVLQHVEAPHAITPGQAADWTVSLANGKTLSVSIPADNNLTQTTYISVTPVGISTASGLIAPGSGYLMASDYFVVCKAATDETMNNMVTVSNLGMQISIPTGDMPATRFTSLLLGIWIEDPIVFPTWTYPTFPTSPVINPSIPSIDITVSTIQSTEYFGPMVESTFSYTESGITAYNDTWDNGQTRYSFANCNSDVAIDKTLPLNGPLYKNIGCNAPTYIINKLGLSPISQVEVSADIHVDPYQWKLFYLKRYEKQYQVQYIDINGASHNETYSNIFYYQSVATLAQCHDQGAAK